MKSLPLVFLFFIVAELAYAVDVPKPFSATYAGRKYLVYTAQAVITLNRHGDSLKYTMSSDVNGPFYHNEYYDCSVMLVQKDNIYPLEHLHTDKKEKKYNNHTLFNWDLRTATTEFCNGKKRTTKDIPVPLWDAVSLNVKIMFDLLNNNLTQQVNYNLIKDSKVIDWPMKITGEDWVVYKGRKFKAIKVETVGRTKTNALWFSVDYELLPLKMNLEGVKVMILSDPVSARQTEAEGIPDLNGVMSGC